jgi:hypothetical protein
MNGVHSKTCSECYHWYRLGEEAVGECFAHPPRVFKVLQANVLNPQQRTEGLVSHFPVTGLACRACGEFKVNLTEVQRKEDRS